MGVKLLVVNVMVNLVIMRHGEAVAQSSTDSERQLTSRGEAEASQMGQWLDSSYRQFDLILCSPYLRARQTAQQVQQQLRNQPPVEVLSDLVPEGDCRQVQLYLDARLSTQPMRVLLVSHMPLVSFLVETFTKSGNTPIFDTAAIACLHYEVGQAGVLLEKTSPAELSLNTHR